MKQTEVKQRVTLLYFQYKDFFLPFMIIAICIGVFIFVIIPQMQSYVSLQNQFTEDKTRFQILQQNFQEVTGLDDQQLDTNFAVTTAALPEEKNAIIILNTISKAASISNVSLKDYNFDVSTVVQTTKQILLPVSLSVAGDESSIQKFVHQLSVSLPISDVLAMDIQNNNVALIKVVFYMQSFTKSSLNTNEPVQLLTDQDKRTLNQILLWQ